LACIKPFLIPPVIISTAGVVVPASVVAISFAAITFVAALVTLASNASICRPRVVIFAPVAAGIIAPFLAVIAVVVNIVVVTLVVVVGNAVGYLTGCSWRSLPPGFSLALLQAVYKVNYDRRCSLVVSSAVSQCKLSNCPGFDTSIFLLSGI
jgi:hypothetical protein